MVAGETEKWDGWRALRDLIREMPELRDLYHRLGYSPYVDERCRKLLGQLDATMSRRPRVSDTFAGAIRELDQLLREHWLPQTHDVRERLLEKVSELREELERERESPLVDTILLSLKGEIEHAVFHIADEEQDEKKRSLYGVLWSLVYVRHNYRPDVPYFIEGVTREAKTYIDSTWMHTRWITTSYLRHFLESEIARQVPAGLSDKGILVSIVAFGVFSYFNLWFYELFVVVALLYYVGSTIWRTHKTRPLVACYQEISSGGYDGHEVGRRLRDLERRGVFVHSVILRLLELDGR